LSEKILILRRTKGDIINVNIVDLHIKYPLCLFENNEIWFFWTYFRRIFYSWKSVQWESSCLRADGRTDRHDECNSRYLQFCEFAWKLKRKLQII